MHAFFLFSLSYQISRKGIVEHFIKEVLHLNIRSAIFELVNTFSFVKANIIWILLLLLLVFTLVLESYWIGERSLFKRDFKIAEFLVCLKNPQ